MKFRELLDIVGDEPIFETGLLLAGDVDPNDVHRQLSRWTKAGRLYQLRRGLYALASPYRHVKPHPFLVANYMIRGSYVSLQSALAYYHLIPEHVPVTTSVTTGRPATWDTPLGRYEFRHIKAELFTGYRFVEVSRNQNAFVASSEKALLDLVYLESGADAPGYLQELRLQNLGQLDLKALHRLADHADSPKLRRAVDIVADLAEIETQEYELL